jgi:hypothetical protein
MLAGVAAGVVATVGGLWLGFQHVPAWYQPVEIPPAQVQRVRDDLTQAENDLNARMILSNAPFEFRITQDRLNAWVSAREEIWPESRNWLPPSVQDPFVTIDEKGVRLAATVSYGSLRTVVSAIVAIRADENCLQLRLVEVRGGSLPAPERFVRGQLKNLERTGTRIGTLGGADAASGGLSRLLDGISLPNSGVWEQPNLGSPDRRRFRVVGVRFEQGVAVVTVRPLEFLNTDRKRRSPGR